MKKILFLAGRYFPKASPNSLCMQNIIQSLPKEDYDITILCYDDGLYCESEYEIIKISRGFIQDELYHLEEKSSWFFSRVADFFLFLSKIKQIPFIPVWPFTDPIFTLKELRIANGMCKEDSFDIVVSIYMPLSSLIVGHMLKKTYPNLRFIAYFLDSLSGGNVPGFMSQRFYEKKSRLWEKKLLNNADKIVFMEASRDYHDSIYGDSDIADRITYLDIPMLSKSRPDSAIDNNGEVRIVYVGSLAQSVRSPEFFLKVFEKVKCKKYKLLFVGDSSCEIVNKYAARDERISVVGRCSHNEALEYEAQATVLLNLGNNNPNLTPSKIFEYMSFGKKIVSTYPIENESSIRYLEKYPLVCLIDENSPIEIAAEQLEGFIEADYPKVHFEDIADLFYQNTPQAFLDLL